MHNFLDPAVLFFLLGVFAGAVRSNLEIPPAISRFLSLYLLMALGLKGGFSLAESGITREVLGSLGVALMLALIVPLIGYQVLRRLASGFDAAALAATYGSVSAVTFVTAVQYLEHQEVAFGGHMAAAMVLMESPAILIAVLLSNSLRGKGQGTSMLADAASPAAGESSAPPSRQGLRGILAESLTDGAQLVLIGAMVVGLLTGEAGREAMSPFSDELFKGLLAFFLLDMGLAVARSFPQARGSSPGLVGYALLAPPVHAGLALALAASLGIGAGDGALLMVLAASASYIAVPAVLRHAIPEANPALYFGLSLGVTFPLNILLGIPVYTAIAQTVLG